MDIRAESITHPDAQRLVEEVQAEYVVRYGGRDDSPIEPGQFAGAAGRFFVGYLGEEAVATGAWRWRPDLVVLGSSKVAELKRMFVAAHARQQGLARAMLHRLEQSAGEAGADVLVLETGLAQPEAIALYRSAGYRSVPKFGHYRESPISRSLGKRIGPLQPAPDATSQDGS